MNGFRECNFDSIVGPTHNYSGLAYGNVASQKHTRQVSYPKQAVLQGLAKMKALSDAGIPQAVLPPLMRPNLNWLRRLGFTGPDGEVVTYAWKKDPAVAAAAYSASNMWAANAATVCPSIDSKDGKVHFTPANLSTTLHRSIEAEDIYKVFSGIFSNKEMFTVHQPLPSATGLTDEGAANHTRLCLSHQKPGLQLFVYGRNALDSSQPEPKKFPARQTLQASQSIARLHTLDESSAFFLLQNPDAIDEGVFHNDVISVGNENVLLTHEMSFHNWTENKQQLLDAYRRRCDDDLIIHEISNEQLPILDVVTSYLFNSQLITKPSGSMMLVSPEETKNNPKAAAAIQNIIAGENPVDEVKYFDLRQSMNNGGGPACLRLRVLLSEQQREAVHPNVWMNDKLYSELTRWANNFYPDQLHPEDLNGPETIVQSFRAFGVLQEILELPLMDWFGQQS